jgi:quercetin dioxygenase-like cupin family protein
MHLMQGFASVLAAALALLTGSAPAGAHDAASGVVERAVLRKQLPEAPGKEARVATVSFAPGQAAAPHRHPGSIFAYVTRGHVVSQLAGGPATTYGPGEGWYEPPGAHHIVARNASDSEPAELVVFAIAGAHDVLTTPLSH